MADILKFLTGCFAVLVLGLASAVLSGVPGSAVSAQNRLQALAGETLSGAASDWAEISMRGQKAVVTGLAPTEEARAQTLAALAISAGPGGVWLGGVTVIDDSGVVVAPPPPDVTPYLLVAESRGGIVLMSGHAPSERLKDDLLTHARLQFPDAEIVETMEIARGAPDERQWLTAASVSLNALARLQNGAVHGADGQFTVSGETADPETAADVALLMSVLPPPFMGEADIRIAETRAVARTGEAAASRLAVASPRAVSPSLARPGAANDNAVSEIEIIARCRAQLADVLETQAISFASGRSELDADSREGLGALASLLRTCPQYHLRITGHTDSNGNATRNLLLSEYRAEVVAAHLGALGVAADRLETLGLGDAEPLFDNATPEGRAGNRRIDLAAFLPAQPRTE